MADGDDTTSQLSSTEKSNSRSGIANHERKVKEIRHLVRKSSAVVPMNSKTKHKIKKALTALSQK